MATNADDTVQLLTQLQRMVRRSDSWRGWVGWDDDAPDDDQVEDMLQHAIECVRAVGSRLTPGE